MKIRKFIVALAITAIAAVGGFSLTSFDSQTHFQAGLGNWAVDDDVG